AGFVAMEVAERLAVGGSLHSLSSGHLLLIGVVAQLVVAAGIALAMSLGARVVEGIVSVIGSAPAASRAAITGSPVLVVAARPVRPAGAWGLRGPPEALSA